MLMANGEIADGPSEVLAPSPRVCVRPWVAQSHSWCCLAMRWILACRPSAMCRRAFLQLLDAFFPEHGEDIFARRNHLHRWQSRSPSVAHRAGQWLRDAVEAGEIPGDLALPPRIFGQPSHRCRLMEIAAAPSSASSRCVGAHRLSQLGLADEERNRAVVMHHGHYLDGMYRALSNMRGFLERDEPRPATMQQLEQENGPGSISYGQISAALAMSARKWVRSMRPC